MEAVIKKETDQNSVFYTVYWSELKKVDKYKIATSVPSVSGIFELYYLDRKKKLNRFFLARAWYGGLRSSLRRRTDTEIENDPARRRVLESYPCYFRYSLSDSYQDMSDILYFFAATYFPGRSFFDPSGRYKNIFVKEISKEKIVTI